jgi:mono/diheme cytochrome c family protein
MEELMRSLKSILNSAWRALFGDTIRAFGTVSLLLLVALAIAPAKNHFSEWRHYQNNYLRMIRDRGDANALQRHFRGGIQQTWIPELGVVDRCTSCHAGVKEASLADVSTQPFRRHPVIPHSLDEFGCVICHRGQDAAVTVEDAHNSKLAGEEPLLPARFMEASCGQCHHAALTGTPKLNQGRFLLSRYGCVRCHTVKLPDGTRTAATDDPPSLVHIAGKTTREWVYAWLKNPSAYAASSTMPNFQLTDDEARDISAYLIGDSKSQPGDTLDATPAAAPDPAAGASLYGQSFCASCHAVQNAAGNLVGGDLGPELTRIGNKAKPQWLMAWLKEPRHYDPGTPMPRYEWTDPQLKLLAGYLLTKSDADLLANVHLDAATPQQIAHGKALVTEYGCAACHEISGIKKPENFAPELSRIGSKPVAQLVFTSGMPHTLPDYLGGKILKPRSFGAGLRMPQFNFTPTQVEALTTALLSLTERSHTLPPRLQLASTPESSYQPAGRAGKLMDEFACLSCHRINGRGGDMAPDLSWEGSSVQRAWLDDFLKNPNTLRPALIRRMPKFNISDKDRAELTDYILTVYQTASIDRDSMPLSGYPPDLVEHGKQLFYSKYSCQACHILVSGQDKGYIGPTLTQVGARLNGAWIYHWLKNPQSLRPGTMEPNWDMSDEDAHALTAFLMMRKKGANQEAKK